MGLVINGIGRKARAITFYARALALRLHAHSTPTPFNNATRAEQSAAQADSPHAVAAARDASTPNAQFCAIDNPDCQACR